MRGTLGSVEKEIPIPSSRGGFGFRMRGTLDGVEKQIPIPYRTDLLSGALIPTRARDLYLLHHG